MLSDVNQLVFDDAAKGLKDHPATSEEIVACCDDLKLLGKLDFKNLLKWRTAVLRDSRFAKPKVGFVSVFSVLLPPSHVCAAWSDMWAERGGGGGRHWLFPHREGVSFGTRRK